MEFILDEAEDNTSMLQFSDEDKEEVPDNKYIPEEGVSFYRERDPQNFNDNPKFHGQTRNPIEAIFSDTESYFGEDDQPELFTPEDREAVDFDKFKGFEKSVENFLKSLLKFEGVNNHIFFPVIYDLIFYRQENDGLQTKLDKKDVQKVLGDELYFDFKEIESETILDKTLFGFFERWYKINKVISKHGFLLKFFERCNMYRFLIKEKVQRKNEVTRNLSACILEKFNGYETIRNNLSRKEKIDFRVIDIVYEPSFDKDIPVIYYFSPNIQAAYRSYIGKFDKGQEKVINRTVRQCHYCQNYFAKNYEQMQKHLSICAAKEGITYSFDNSQIIDYQDNYKYIEDLPFTVYFHFETTTGDAVFFYSKMLVISYCMIFSFNKALNFDKIVIFRSFQQSINELYDISHFRPEHVPFFDQVILRQLKDAASAVAFREKCTSLAEMFSVELKSTVDTLKAWFNKILKPKFFEVDYDKKEN